MDEATEVGAQWTFSSCSYQYILTASAAKTIFKGNKETADKADW